MSDRTRLDEIAWEEFRAWQNNERGICIDLLKSVAIAAFRHGVERGVHAAIQNHPSFTMFDSVQPAPAAEAKQTVEGFRGLRWGHELDRRKGERRKGLEAKNWVHGDPLGLDPSRPVYQVNDHGSFQYDRRQKDRRRG